MSFDQGLVLAASAVTDKADQWQFMIATGDPVGWVGLGLG